MLIHRHQDIKTPQRKPRGGFSAYELDPTGKLSRGIALALVPFGPAGLGSMLDFVVPGRKFSIVSAANFGQSQFGNTFNAGFSATNQIQFSPAIGTITGANFSISALVQADASAHGGFNNVLLSASSTATEYVMVNGATGTWGAGSPFIVGAQSSVINMAGLTGWNRLGLTVNGTAVRFFLNGKFTDNGTMSGTLSLANPNDVCGATIPPGNSSWGWPTADIFVWNRTLTDSEMATHWVMPYRSVLRPRGGELQRTRKYTSQYNPWPQRAPVLAQ